MQLCGIAQEIRARAAGSSRFMIAIAGPPGSGKTTLAGALAERLSNLGETAAVVGMDGFHYDDRVLEARGLSHRKGAPETFDFAGFRSVLARIRTGEPQVAVPIFDRTMELSRAAATIVEEDDRLIVVEGNYLLLDETPWATLATLFDFSIYMNVPTPELKRRLLRRWHEHGRDPEAARLWVETNDLRNADRVADRRLKADMVLGDWEPSLPT